jgi:hypothetical protein
LSQLRHYRHRLQKPELRAFRYHGAAITVAWLRQDSR